MTPLVCRTLEEHQTRTAEVQREREIAEKGWRACGGGEYGYLDRFLDREYPLPVLAPQGVRGKSGRTYRIVLCSAPGGCSIVQSYNTDNTAPNNHVAVGDERAAALALLGAEGLADLYERVRQEMGFLRLGDQGRREVLDAWPALCAKAAQ